MGDARPRFATQVPCISRWSRGPVGASPPVVQFEFTYYRVTEDAEKVVPGVALRNESTSEISVDYATAAGTAFEGVDFTGASGRSSFAPGERVKLISIPILNDGLKEPGKVFRVTLSNPTAGAVLGGISGATASFHGKALARAIHQDASHGLSGSGEEVRPILPGRLLSDRRNPWRRGTG